MPAIVFTGLYKCEKIIYTDGEKIDKRQLLNDEMTKTIAVYGYYKGVLKLDPKHCTARFSLKNSHKKKRKKKKGKIVNCGGVQIMSRISVKSYIF